MNIEQMLGLGPGNSSQCRLYWLERCKCGGRTTLKHTSSELQSNAQTRGALLVQRHQRYNSNAAATAAATAVVRQQWYNSTRASHSDLLWQPRCLRGCVCAVFTSTSNLKINHTSSNLPRAIYIGTPDYVFPLSTRDTPGFQVDYIPKGNLVFCMGPSHDGIRWDYSYGIRLPRCSPG